MDVDPAFGRSLPGVGRLVRWTARPAFIVYVPVLTALTHWPELKIEGPTERPDLIAHAGTFGLWTGLLICTGWLAPLATFRNAWRCGAVGLAYSVLDELTQAIPGINRHVDAMDLAANALGVVLAVAIGLAWAWVGRRVDVQGEPTRPTDDDA